VVVDVESSHVLAGYHNDKLGTEVHAPTFDGVEIVFLGKIKGSMDPPDRNNSAAL